MADTQQVPFRDRTLSVRPLNEMQKALLVREMQLVRSAKQPIDRKLQGIANIINIIESSVVDGDDREYIMELAGMGLVEFKEILDVATAFEALEGEVVAPNRSVRRATARKR